MTRIRLRAACGRASVFLFGATLAGHAVAGCDLYEHREFLGASLTIQDNQALAHLGDLNDRVSSIIITSGCLLIAYADPQFAGAVTTFSAGKHPLLPDGWDDEISSARCNCR
jgi:Beta/Gamma crystallin